MHNRVTLIGNMATDAELRYTAQEAIPVANFRIACNRPRRKGEDGAADFFDVVLWRQDAEFAANYLETGRLVFVEGELRNREYTNQQNQKVRVTEIHAREFKALDRPKSEGSLVPEGGTDNELPPTPSEENGAAPRTEVPDSDPTNAFAG